LYSTGTVSIGGLVGWGNKNYGVGKDRGERSRGGGEKVDKLEAIPGDR